MARMTRSVLADESGRLKQRSIQRGPREAPWRNLTREEDDLTAVRPEAFLYPRDGSPITPLRKVTLVVSTTRFVADGTEVCSVKIKGDVSPGEEVKVLVGSDVVYLSPGEVVGWTANAAGVYTVTLDDDRFYAEVPTYVVMAVAPSS